MHDYQLDRLNTRSFEQLVQSLGTQILGNQLSIYGDGPDGGREAVFDGSVSYPVESKQWNGYGIVQAKFRQEPDSSPKKNADWVLRRLAEEFTAFTRRTRRGGAIKANTRICPEYYVLATNVSLSAAPKRGGKDRVRLQLESYKKSHGLKDYAIWDGNQIRRYLDAYPGVRTTYLGWLLPGDIFAEILKVFDWAKPDFTSTLRRFLQCELLDDQFARLSQGGYTDAKSISLSSVFLDLPLASQSDSTNTRRVNVERIEGIFQNRDKVKPQEQPTFLDLLLEEGQEVLRPSALRCLIPEKGASTVQDGRIVLIGGPGQGKTTLGQFACQLHRAALLRASEGKLSPEVLQALQRIEQFSGGLPHIGARRYPLRVDLKHFAASLASAEQGSVSLLSYLAHRISSRTNTNVQFGEFRHWLGAYPWMLVLDGLDEVPSSSNRQQVMHAIRDFISVDAYEADADLLILATTRPQGYSDEFSPALYQHVSLSPLDDRSALLYGTRLATARHPDQPTRIEELVSSLRRATQNPATVRLMQSPLQVTIMLALIEGGGEPPEQRWKLFHDYYDVIYRREKERGTSFSAMLGRYEPDIHWIHHRAGWILQQRNAAAGSTSARLTHEEFEKLVDERLLNSGHNELRKRSELVGKIRQAATDRLVFLVGNTDSEIGFEIRSLQEFMAAEHFFDGGESCVHKALHTIAPLTYWRNVFLFVAGRIFFQRQELIDSVLAVCGAMNESPLDSSQRAVLSGSRLALALLRDGAARNQPASIRVIARCAARGFDACEDEDGSSLAELFSGEAEEVLRDEITRRLTTESGVFPYHNWLVCTCLAAAGKAWAENLLLQHFPWEQTVAARLLLNLNPSEIQLSPSIWQTFEQQLVKHPIDILDVRYSAADSSRSESVDNLLRGVLKLSEANLEEGWPLRVGGQTTRLRLGVRGFASLGLWVALEYPQPMPPFAHLDWKLAQVASVFARNPTETVLVEQVRAISEICPEVIPERRSWFPWQITVCLAARKEGVPWESILRNVESGRLGTEQDWKRWEELQRSGLALSTCRTADDWGVSDERLGLVTRECDWSFVHSVDHVRAFGRELSGSLSKLKDQEPLINLCCAALYRLASDAPANDPLPVRDFVRACASERVAITTSLLLAVVLDESLSDAERVDLLATTGSCAIKPGWLWDWADQISKVSQRLVRVIDTAISGPQWPDVLRAVSLLPPSDALLRIPESCLTELSKMGAEYRQAGAVLRLGRLDWDVGDVEEHARWILACDSANSKLLSSLLDFIEFSGAAGPPMEEFLIYLLNFGKRTLEPERVAHAMSLLIKLIQRRPAVGPIPDPAIRH